MSKYHRQITVILANNGECTEEILKCVFRHVARMKVSREITMKNLQPPSLAHNVILTFKNRFSGKFGNSSLCKIRCKFITQILLSVELPRSVHEVFGPID